ncbi:hypothetical protein Aph01nite_47260 [Acrocarpospora phusangensis]|uniref:non-specific serine/threonine protein kinase n=1 Tax=Acrocarpospora phusangensis TaxID=1070424 RepID=A0A919ULP3_9ACTN|nr:serine/threonine-protein kinase [Acrocarpospora phusangensis]GIH26416.1 hypothetical protein Aph01nite_47260 [Acrocarpospora phusangensis]
MEEERRLAGRYRLLETIGRGGMGVVWRAHDELLDRAVAVKEVRHGPMDEQDRAAFNRRTIREARAAGRLSHPNVVVVHDVIEEDGRPWIVMQLVQSRSLGQILREHGPLVPERAAAIGLQILEALAAAHAAGVLHRDVKPENVLIGGDSRVVLTDFGIATLTEETSLTLTGGVTGTPAFLPPERLNGQPATPESDLWSLGATIYAAVEGRSPYDRSTPIASMAAVLHSEPDPPRRAGPLTPVIEGLLRKDPTQRIDISEAQDLLRHAASPPPSPATPPGLYGSPGSSTPPGHPGSGPSAPSGHAGLHGSPGSYTPSGHPSSEPSTPSGHAGPYGSPGSYAPSGHPGSGPSAPPSRHAELYGSAESSTLPGPPGFPAPSTPSGHPGPAGSSTPSGHPGPPQAFSPPGHPGALGSFSPSGHPDTSGSSTPSGHSSSPGSSAPSGHPGPYGSFPPSGHPDALGSFTPSGHPGSSGVGWQQGGASSWGAQPTAPPAGGGSWGNDGLGGWGNSPSAQRAGSQRRRLVGFVLVPVLVIVLGVGGWFGYQSLRDPGVGLAGPTSEATTEPTENPTEPTGKPEESPASPSESPSGVGASPVGGTPSASPAAAVPEGWRSYRDELGFAIALPEGWRAERVQGAARVRFRGPGMPGYLQVDLTPWEEQDPVEALQTVERNSTEQGFLPEYQRIDIRAAEYQGVPAAEWEFTFKTSSGRQRVIDRAFRIGDDCYALYWQVPEANWQAGKRYFTNFTRTFRPK